MTTCVILQPSYVPWPGVFQLISVADVFVHLDDVQFDKGGWRHRNYLKGPNGVFWLTIPVRRPHGTRQTLVKDVEVAGREWRQTHLKSVAQSYAKAPHVDWLMDWFRPAMERHDHSGLVEITIPLIETLTKVLGLQSHFVRSSSLHTDRNRNMRLIEICRQVDSNRYISGPSARSYLNVDLFAAHGIEVDFVRYRTFDYHQLHGEFTAKVSILDALAMLGPETGQILFGGQRFV